MPFAGNHSREMLDNFLFFLPLGLLLGINYKSITFRRKLAFVFVLSLVVESLQFVFAIGATDITDVIMNTCGGFIGLILYNVAHKYIKGEKFGRLFDLSITGIVAALLIVFILLRVFVFKVRY